MSFKSQLIAVNNLRLKIQNGLICNPVMVWMFKSIAFNGYGKNRCLKSGFLPVPVHFYSPIPDIEDLKQRKVWSKRSELKGIDFNISGQLSLLNQLGAKFGSECQWPKEQTKSRADFYLNNGCFSFGCAASLHTMIRQFKPRQIVEIGSGFSSKIIASALKKNETEGVPKSTYTIIDPYPTLPIKKRLVKFDKIIDKKVETVKLEFFDRLGKNDILFIDSSHSVKVGGDVNMLYLDVLPRLKPGVIVHIHDIHLPYEYEKEYATNEVFKQFWTEQYLLQAFLVNNKEFEVLLGMRYLMIDHLPKFKKAFKFHDPNDVVVSGSFWMRRV